MCPPSWRRARIAAQRLSALARLRRVRDRIDREHARPLDVEALARAAGMPPGHLGRAFRLAYGVSPCAYLMARRVERAALLRQGPRRDRGPLSGRLPAAGRLRQPLHRAGRHAAR